MKLKTLSALGVAALLVLAGCTPTNSSSQDKTTTTTTETTTTETSTVTETTTTTETVTFEDVKKLMEEICMSLYGTSVEGEDYVVETDDVGQLAFTTCILNGTFTNEEAFNNVLSLVPLYMTELEEYRGEGEFLDGTAYYGSVFTNEDGTIALEVAAYTEAEYGNLVQFLAYLVK